MAGRFQNPYPQFEDSTPAVYSGGGLYFYATGTSTPLNTYTTKALSVANPNPVVLNSAGRPGVDIYLQDLEYKVVLKDASLNTIWTADPISHRDSGLVAKTVTGSGSPNGSVAGTAGSASILPDFYWDYTNAILYVATTTGNAATTVWTAVNATTAAAVVPPPQGYLTLTSATPVIASDVTAATAVYYTPYTGILVPIYNGSSYVPTSFISEMTLSLVSSHAASQLYDVFVFSNSGVVTIGTGPSWAAGTSGSVTAGSCARGTGAGGTALSRVQGLYTNAVQITARNGSTTYTVAANQGTYVGSIFMDGTNGQISCHRSWGASRKWGVWNAYNRKQLYLKAGDSTASWTNTSATIRASNGASTNSLTVFSGLAEEIYDLSMAQKTDASVGNPNCVFGVGYNSILAFSGMTGISNPLLSPIAQPARYAAAPALGINVISALEANTPASGTARFFGGEANMLLQGTWQG